jgi:hypothetical protein
MTFWEQIKDLAVEVRDVILSFVSVIPWWDLFLKVLQAVLKRQDLILEGELKGGDARESVVEEFVDEYVSEIGALGEPDILGKFENRIRRLIEVAVYLMWTLGKDRVLEIAHAFKVDVDAPSRASWANKYDPMAWYISRPDKPGR